MVPDQKLQALNGTETEQPFPFHSFLLHLKAKVLQLQLANAAPGFVQMYLYIALCLPTTKTQQNLWWLELCV